MLCAANHAWAGHRIRTPYTHAAPAMASHGGASPIPNMRITGPGITGPGDPAESCELHAIWGWHKSMCTSLRATLCWVRQARATLGDSHKTTSHADTGQLPVCPDDGCSRVLQGYILVTFIKVAVASAAVEPSIASTQPDTHAHHTHHVQHVSECGCRMTT